jgi:hypothetical protein
MTGTHSLSRTHTRSTVTSSCSSDIHGVNVLRYSCHGVNVLRYSVVNSVDRLLDACFALAILELSFKAMKQFIEKLRKLGVRNRRI